MIVLNSTYSKLFVRSLLLGITLIAGCLNLLAQEYEDPPLPYGQDYTEPLRTWENFKEGALRDLPNGYYSVNTGDQRTYAFNMRIVKKGGSFLLTGGFVSTDIAPLTICATGTFKDSRLLFDEIIKVRGGRDEFGSKPVYKFVESLSLAEIDLKRHPNSIKQFRMSFFDIDNIAACTEALPLISNRLRVVDSETNEEWNLKGAVGLTHQSIVSVISVDVPQSAPVLNMPVLSNQPVEANNGRFSSLNKSSGSEENLVDGKQYFLRATLYYQDNIFFGNRHLYNFQPEGCNAPNDGIIERKVVRDSKPFTIKRGFLRKLVDDGWPWRAGHDTSTPSGKAAFDRDVDKYNQSIDREITRIMTQPTNIDFPPPIVLLHGILSCHEDWGTYWTTGLGERHVIADDQNSPMAGLITFTPNYDYWVQGQWQTYIELKALRDNMATAVTVQIWRDLHTLLSDSKTKYEIYLIAHSNGGVVARPLSKIKDQGWTIKKIYTMGSPHSGTLFPMAKDFGLDDDQMTGYNCLEGGFDPETKVAALAGKANTKILLRPIKHSAYVRALGEEKFSDGSVYPQGSTYIILCQKPAKTFSRMQTIPLISESALFHSDSFGAGNFLDKQGVELFEKVIAPDMGLK